MEGGREEEREVLVLRVPDSVLSCGRVNARVSEGANDALHTSVLC